MGRCIQNILQWKKKDKKSARMINGDYCSMCLLDHVWNKFNIQNATSCIAQMVEQKIVTWQPQVQLLASAKSKLLLNKSYHISNYVVKNSHSILSNTSPWINRSFLYVGGFRWHLLLSYTCYIDLFALQTHSRQTR